jgi:hypothetical protein
VGMNGKGGDVERVRERVRSLNFNPLLSQCSNLQKHYYSMTQEEPPFFLSCPMNKCSSMNCLSLLNQ